MHGRLLKHLEVSALAVGRSPDEFLLDSRFLRQLERLRLSPRGALTEREMGDEPSRRHGASVEFADYREYQPGDDYRNIDWTLLARLDHLFVRLFQAEENLRLELYLDASTSMHFGHPSKAEYAARLAAALGYVALRNGDRVSASFFGEVPHSKFPNTRGRQATAALFRFLSERVDAGRTDVNSSLNRLAREANGSGIALVISDLMDPGGYEVGLDALVRMGRRVAVIHLLSPDELSPEATGDFEWIDSETNATVEISVDSETLALYRETLSRWLREIHAFCNSRHIAYFQVNTDTPIPDLVLRHLREGGLLS